jgi:iron complex transport system substrate-binding protein
LVGVTRYCNYPPEAHAKEQIGDLMSPNLEKIVSLQPDLVLAERWTSSRVVPRLRRFGVRVVETVSPSSIAQVGELIRTVGAAIGKQAEADELVRRIDQRVKQVEARSARLERHPLVYVEIDPPAWTVGRNSYTSEAIRLAGGRNLFDDVARPSIQVSKEEIIRRNPEVILSFAASADEIGRRPGWSSIRAVQHGCVIDDFNRDLLSRGTYRLVEGIEELERRFEQLQR